MGDFRFAPKAEQEKKKKNLHTSHSITTYLYNIKDVQFIIIYIILPFLLVVPKILIDYERILINDLYWLFFFFLLLFD
ncbi:hypothetical protein BC936DRAFT_145263 [Jimgerdemannia flammicorona]|uniref:Uncharacterized protein n=1 Tax=Jimgerdemannia flammicorona TaxID=994334 RepID=A0A433DAI3_9FUNG|nr:hypothetical protein BC936DRAFT_145263 [Jimgerdemannia flammicorona]